MKYDADKQPDEIDELGGVYERAFQYAIDQGMPENVAQKIAEEALMMSATLQHGLPPLTSDGATDVALNILSRIH